MAGIPPEADPPKAGNPGLPLPEGGRDLRRQLIPNRAFQGEHAIDVPRSDDLFPACQRALLDNHKPRAGALKQAGQGRDKNRRIEFQYAQFIHDHGRAFICRFQAFCGELIEHLQVHVVGWRLRIGPVAVESPEHAGIPPPCFKEKGRGRARRGIAARAESGGFPPAHLFHDAAYDGALS